MNTITKEEKETNSDITDHPACNLSFGENSVSIFCSFRKVKEVKVDLRCIFTNFFSVLSSIDRIRRGGKLGGCSDIRKKGQEMACFHIFLDMKKM